MCYCLLLWPQLTEWRNNWDLDEENTRETEVLGINHQGMYDLILSQKANCIILSHLSLEFNLYTHSYSLASYDLCLKSIILLLEMIQVKELVFQHIKEIRYDHILKSVLIFILFFFSLV